MKMNQLFKISAIVLMTTWITSLSGQGVTVSGVLQDQQGQGIMGATIRLLHPEGELVQGQVSDEKGHFELKNVAQGIYIIEMAFLGYETRRQEIDVKNKSLQLGSLTLIERSLQLDAVEVKEKAPTATQIEDTIQYNATAFKVMKDANADELIGKMPGMQVDGAQIKAQGETVGRVLVDGKPFFGNDPSAALKNLPAEVIDKIQVFDQGSEQAQFSGIQDGNTVKTINIVTKSDMRAGQFGKVYAGYGTDDRYQAGGNVNLFKGTSRISLIGMVNNINIQNFASEDILGVLGTSGGQRGPSMPGGRGQFRNNSEAQDFLVNASGGITKTYAGGVNYSDTWGKKTEVSASYFFNQGDNTLNNQIIRNFISTENSGPVFQSEEDNSSVNINHRFNMRLEYKMDSMNMFIYKPRITYQSNNGQALAYADTRASGIQQNESSTDKKTKLNGLTIDNELVWRHRFSRPKHTLSITATGGISPRKGNTNLFAENRFFFPNAMTDTLDQQTSLDNEKFNASGMADYTLPVSEKVQLLGQYKYSYQQEESALLTNEYDELSGTYSLLNDVLSNRFISDFNTHNGAAGVSYSPNDNFNITTRMHYQNALLANAQSLPQDFLNEKSFSNWLPFLSIRYSFDKQRNIRLFYRSSAQMPNLDQLQNVLNNQNPLQLRYGNPDLKQSVTHSLFTRYQATLPAKSQTFFIMGRVAFTEDQIINSTWVNETPENIPGITELPSGAQLIIPVNISGAWQARSFMTYGLPLSFLKSNLNLDASYQFSQNPGMLNGSKFVSQNQMISGGVVISSNVSDKLDFSISYRPSWNIVRSTGNAITNQSFLNQTSMLRVNWQTWAGIVIRSDVQYIRNGGLAEGFNQNFVLWNAALGKKVFRNERGEVAIAVNDMLRQNRNINRQVTEVWLEDTWTNALTRFVMLSFTYNIRNFGKGTPRPPREPEGHGRW